MIRKWIVIDQVLYCGVRYSLGSKTGGAVLRWTGNVQEPFHFEIVGYLPVLPAELEYHDGRIYAGTWPHGTNSAEIYRSPELTKEGLTAANATTWKSVWSYDMYETDPFSKLTAGIGGFKSFKGRLYWGMLNVSWAASFGVSAAYHLKDMDEKMTGVLGTFRSSALFSATDFSKPNDVELLFGEERLPTYNPKKKEWKILKNASGLKPKWGRSGLGNMYTNYIWSMEVYNDKLYVGTMDMYNLVEPAVKSTLVPDKIKDAYGFFSGMLKLDPEKYGFECMVIEDHDRQPYLITDNGLGVDAAYGIRNMIVLNDVLYVGTASPLNLKENAGWRLYSFTDHTIPASNQIVPKEADVIYRQSDYYLEFTSMKGQTIQSVKLIDMSGRIIRSDEPQSSTAIVVTQGCPSGVYIARLQIGDQKKVIKVMIK